MKKTVRSSHLALRFYVKDRWTLAELDVCCNQGGVFCPYPEDERPYFVLNKWGRFDIDRLLPLCGDVIDWQNRPVLDKRRYLEEMNG